MHKVNFKPINDRILGRQVFEEIKVEENKFGFITDVSGITEQDLKDKSKLLGNVEAKKKATTRVEVVRVGVNVKEVAEGDLIHTNGNFLTLKHNEETFVLIKEADVNGIIEP